jgi:shikimate kinase
MNIYLIGYRGTGKSTLGIVTAALLSRPYVDTDELIVEREGLTIPEILHEFGETRFRSIESDVLSDISRLDGLVAATGGGIVLSEENRLRMKQSGICVWLTSPPEIIVQRITGDQNRPTFTGSTVNEEVLTLLLAREPLYRELADIVVDTSAAGVKECAKVLVQKIRDAER